MTRIPMIPARSRPVGPATRTLLRRTYSYLAVIAGVGMLPVLLGMSPAWKALGLGLVLPGGGFLYTGDYLLAAIALAAFPAVLLLWWLVGNVLVPPTYWVATALLAASRADGPVQTWAQIAVPVILGALVVGRMTYYWVRNRLANSRGARYNAALAAEAPVVSIPPPAANAVREADPDELPSLRYVLDLALQPIDRFDGFFYLKFDQFREGALRYQINHLAYATALYQYTHTPAFSGYLAEAQRNAIQKALDKRVWKYWSLENLWGNLRWNPDPIIDDNVMYSAYLGLMLGLYETMNQDSRYRQPGALTLRWNDRTAFVHDANTITTAVLDNLNRSRAGLYPCEPNWIYPFCNTFAFNHLLLDDRLSGTDNAGSVIERARSAYDAGDWCEPDGRLAGLRSEHLGTRGPGGGNMADAMNAYWLNPIMPDLAQRTWWLVRRYHLGPQDDPANFPHSSWDRVDPGNYMPVDGFARAALTACAVEFGDDELAEALDGSFDKYLVEQDGARRYKRISVWSNMWLVLARFGRADAVRGLIRDGIPEEWKTGPRLCAAAYPDVMVTYAVTDGHALNLVVQPGNGAVRTRLAFDRLRPGQTYRIDGGLTDTITAEANGHALLDIDIDRRLELRLHPAP